MTHIQTVQSFFQHFGTRNLEKILAMLTPDVHWSVPGDAARIPWTGERHGHAQMPAFFEAVYDPNIAQVRAFNINKMFEDGDDVLVMGDFAYHYPASGRDYAGDFIIHFRVRGEQIAGYKIYEDSASIASAYLGH
jgi:uncharacterized protein